MTQAFHLIVKQTTYYWGTPIVAGQLLVVGEPLTAWTMIRAKVAKLKFSGDAKRLAAAMPARPHDRPVRPVPAIATRSAAADLR